jgi:hypothetical protein
MRLRTIAAVTMTLALTPTLSRAAHVWEDPSGWWSGHLTYDQSAPLYNAQEVSLDLFGSYINPEQKFENLFHTNIRRGFWGGGAGLNYFLTRNLGLGTDFNISDKADRLVDYWIGNVILRFPLGASGLAPYVLGGGGRGMSPVYEWVYGGGAGLEYRFNPTTGIFGDGTFLWSDKSTYLDTLTLRVGLRLVF